MYRRIPDRTTDLRVHELAWFADQLGNRTAAIPYGNYRIGTYGDDPDTPISSAALGVILNLSGLAAGAATVGCCCNIG